MTEQSTKKGSSGSQDGEWYLRLLGFEPEGGPATLQDVTQSKDASKTTGLVNDMWEQTSEFAALEAADDALAGWEPTELSSTVSSRRVVRWPIVIIALVVGTAAALALWLMPQVSERRASNHADLMQTSLIAVYSDLAGDVQQALATVTEPASEDIDLGAVAASLAGIADSAARLLDVANEPTPSPLPLTAREPFDDLAQTQAQLEPLAAEATAIRTEIADIADYRLALADVLAVDELPITADSATITEQSALLAEALADSVAALAAMPADGPFTEHRALVETEITGFAQWQEDYLNALRSGDSAQAESLITSLRITRRSLANQLVPTLAELRTDIDGRIIALAKRIDAAADGLR